MREWRKEEREGKRERVNGEGRMRANENEGR